MITIGQARRIAADWQTPRNGFGVLQHTGEITNQIASDIARELLGDLSVQDDPEQARRDLAGLERFVYHYGLGKVEGWGEWSDEPVTESQLKDY